jgi:hypothetical protein
MTLSYHYFPFLLPPLGRKPASSPGFTKLSPFDAGAGAGAGTGAGAGAGAGAACFLGLRLAGSSPSTSSSNADRSAEFSSCGHTCVVVSKVWWGRLEIVICNAVVRDEAVWNAVVPHCTYLIAHERVKHLAVCLAQLGCLLGCRSLLKRKLANRRFKSRKLVGE